VASKKRARASVAAATDRVRDEWLRRVEAEYRSAAITQHLTLWLMQIGASPDLVKLGLRIAADEMAHSDLSHRAYVAAGGTAMPHISRESLELRRRPNEPLENDVARVCGEIFCIGETVAVPLFKEIREKCVAPSARRCLDRVLRDEVRHRDFGWTLMPWLLESPAGESLRALVARELPQWFARVRGMYAPAAARTKSTVADEDRAWGLIAPARYGEILRRTLDRDWVPRFGALGFDARAAWHAQLAAEASATPESRA
jgi:hypothetical protein